MADRSPTSKHVPYPSLFPGLIYVCAAPPLSLSMATAIGVNAIVATAGSCLAG